MNSLANFKDQAIREYLTSVNFAENFSVKQIKRELHRLLGESPAIQLEYKKEELFSEGVGEPPRLVEKVKSITVTFSDGNEQDGLPHVQHVTYYI